MAHLKVSAISFLNTAPLMWDFVHGNAGEGFDIHYTVPSKCAEELRLGTADIGIIPVFTYALIPGLVIIPDIAIATKGVVRSILLISKVPVDQIRSVALDTSSRTSVALTKVLFGKFWGGEHTFLAHDPDVEQMLAKCDAALVIGDPALRARTAGYHVYDLATEWKRFTGKPFVFAVWAIRMAALTGNAHATRVVEIFQRSRDNGLRPENIDQLAREWAPKIGISEQDVHAYLTENIHYHLDAENLEGLALFFRYAAELQLIEAPPDLRFLPAHSWFSHPVR
jgi:chorismate dehydratase